MTGRVVLLLPAGFEHGAAPAARRSTLVGLAGHAGAAGAPERLPALHLASGHLLKSGKTELSIALLPLHTCVQLKILYHRVKVVVAPLLSGAGVKGKVGCCSWRWGRG